MKILVTVILSAGLLLAGLLGGVVSESRSAGPAPVDQTQAAALRSEFGSADTVSLVRRLQDQARARPDDAQTNALLGLAYAQRARETGDAAFYSRADAVLRRAHELDARNVYALTGLGGIALARHRFADALRIGRAAQAAAPGSAAPYGVVGDAQLELGRYRAAFATFDRMAALKPNASSYSRVSYARELRGDVAGAIEAMELALDASIGRPEATAWIAVELGKLHWSVGRVAESASHYRFALQVVPGYVPALDALARVEAARGHTTRAIALQRRAVESIPLPSYVAQLGDLLASAGRPVEAREQYALVGSIERLQVANGVKVDLETALYRTDHGIRLRDSLSLARRAHAERPSVVGDDVLAWALARNGRCGEALCLLEALAPARHAGRDLLLPPRDDRTLPRPACRGPQLVRARSRAEPALLHSLGTHRTGGTQMKRLLVLAGCLAALLAPAAAQAHPLGNFTINRHTAIELSGGRIYVQYALDLAEIPTLQQGKRVRASGFAAETARGLELQVDWQARAAPGPRAPHGRAAGGGRPEDAPFRRCLRDRGDRGRSSRSATATSARGSAGRKWWCARATAPSCAPPAFPPRAGATGSAPTPRTCSARRSTLPLRPRRSLSAKERARRRRSTASRRPSIAAAASRR